MAALAAPSPLAFAMSSLAADRNVNPTFRASVSTAPMSAVERAEARIRLGVVQVGHDRVKKFARQCLQNHPVPHLSRAIVSVSDPVDGLRIAVRTRQHLRPHDYQFYELRGVMVALRWRRRFERAHLAAELSDKREAA